MVGKYALVTGGSSGIGLAIARELAARQYHLLLVSNQEALLLQAQQDLQQNYAVQVHTLLLDLSQPQAAPLIIDYCRLQQLSVQVLVNNAGFFFFGEIAEADAGQAQQMVQLHLLTSSLLCTHFGKEMKRARQGYILNNASISAYKAFPGIGYYGSTKAYIKSFTRSLRYELKPYGVHVTCLCPGATATALYDPNVINVELGKKLGVMISAERVAALGVDGLFANKAVVIPGWMTKLMLGLSLLTPNWLISFIRQHNPWMKAGSKQL